MVVSYPISLEVKEPNNDIGILRIRQSDEESQTLVVQVLEYGLKKSYEGLQVFFCARIGQTAGLGIIEQKLLPSEMTDPKNGKLEYTFRAEDWQVLGHQNGYFSFRKMTDDHTYVQQFSTRDFTYEVTKSIYSDGIKEVKKDGSTYVWTIEDLIRLFNEYIDSGKSDWEEFVEQNREIIESVDPGGLVLSELIDARRDIDGNLFPRLPDRLNVMQKFSKDANFYVTPEMFGAKGDGLIDDTASLQEAIDYSHANQIPLFAKRKRYLLDQVIVPGIDFQFFGNFAELKALSAKPIIKIVGAVKNLLMDNLELLPSYDKTGIGMLFEAGDNIIQNLNLDNVKISNFEDNLVLHLGDKANTSSGIVGLLFKNCQLKLAKHLGLYVKQPNIDGRAWFNQNRLVDCDISDNGSGMYIENVSTQNLTFENCLFERNGYCESEFDKAFAFKAENIFNVDFKGCYFENNIPYRIATQTDIDRFNASSQVSSAGNKIIGDEELWWDYHNQGIRPTGHLDPQYFGDVIINSKAVPKVNISNSIISLSTIVISLLTAGDAIIEGSYYFNRLVSGRYPSCAYQSIFYLKNNTVNPSRIKNVNNRFSGGETGVKKVLEIDGVLSNTSMLEGDFWRDRLYQSIRANRNVIDGTNDIYISDNGDDENIGVLPDYPIRTIARAIQKAQIMSAPFVNIHLDGHFNIDEIYNIGTKKIVFVGENKTSTSINTKATNQGYLYFEVQDTVLEFKNLTVNLVKPPNVTNFIFNFLVNANGKSTIKFDDCTITGNDTSCSLVYNKDDDCTVNFDNTSFGGTGAVYRGYPSNPDVRSLVVGTTSWQYGKRIGSTAERPILRFLTAGYQYFDTTLNKPIWWSGSTWRDSNGAVV